MEAITSAERKYGSINLLKLTPLANMAMISVLVAILDVKKITAMNVNSGLNIFM
jgi:hypothetical protein